MGESLPNDINCSVPNIRLFPDVGFTELFALILDALNKKLIKVFSDGQLPS